MVKVILVLFILMSFTSCKKNNRTGTQPAVPGHPRLSYEEYANSKWYDYYKRNKLDSARVLLEKHLEIHAEELPTLTLYAELLRRQDKFVLADSMADKVLSLDSSDGDAWLVKAIARSPHYSRKNAVIDTTEKDADFYLLEGIKRDSTNGNLWEFSFDTFLKKGDITSYKRALHRLYGHGHLTEKALEVARLYLKQLPPNAIFITAGDMDTYPLLAVQEVESLRKDVLVVNFNLLNLKWYIKTMFALSNTPLPCSEQYIDSLKIIMTPQKRHRYKSVAKQFLDTLVGDTLGKRPICLVSNMGSDALDGYYTVFKGHYQLIVKDRIISRYDFPAMVSTQNLINLDKLKGDYVSTLETAPILLNMNIRKRIDINILMPSMVVGWEKYRLRDSTYIEMERFIQEYCDSIGNMGPMEHYKKYKDKYGK